MKAIVVTDQAAGMAGMTLVDRPEPQAAINDVVVQVYASGFVNTELGWPSTWTDRLDRDRTPSIPGHELAGVVTALGYGTTGLSVGQRVFGLTDWYRDGTLAEYAAVGGAQPRAAAGRRRLHGGREPSDLGLDRVAGTDRTRPPSGGAARDRARRGRRGRIDGDATRT
jgi:NADPH:quinone reductase-like Zn-dependent oxidoreductase